MRANYNPFKFITRSIQTPTQLHEAEYNKQINMSQVG